MELLVGERAAADLAVHHLVGQVPGRAGASPVDHRARVVLELERRAHAQLVPGLAGTGVAHGVGARHEHAGHAVDGRPVVDRQAHEVADRGERQLDGEVLDEVGRPLLLQQRHELGREALGVLLEVVLEQAHRLRGERPGGQVAERRVAGLVHVHEVGHLVEVPARHLDAPAGPLPHAGVVLDRRQAQARAPVDEEPVVGAHPVDVVVAGDRPERRDVVALVPEDRRLPPEQVPRLPRVAPCLEEVRRVDVDRREVGGGERSGDVRHPEDASWSPRAPLPRGVGLRLAEAERVGRLPAPVVAAHGPQVEAGPPPERPRRARRVGVDLRHVAGPAGDHLVRQVAPDRLAGRRDHLEDGRADARPEVVGVPARALGVERGQCGEVALGEVDHVDVVAHAGAVARGPVAAVHVEVGAPAHRHLHEERHEVVGDPAGILAELARGVGADRVEVAQHAHAPRRTGHGHVVEDPLDEELRAAVGAVGVERPVLGERDPVGLAVDGGRRREHEPADAVALHGIDELVGRAEVVAVVPQGLGHRLADGLQAGEVDHGVDRVGREDGVEGAGVGHVGVDDRQVPPGHAAHGVDGPRGAVHEVVDDHDVVAGVEQGDAGVGPDVAGTAGHQDGRGVGGGHRPSRVPGGVHYAPTPVTGTDHPTWRGGTRMTTRPTAQLTGRR